QGVLQMASGLELVTQSPLAIIRVLIKNARRVQLGKQASHRVFERVGIIKVQSLQPLGLDIIPNGFIHSSGNLDAIEQISVRIEALQQPSDRSEERRVGKESRISWESCQCG